jgi:hypothetical protein
MTSRLDYFIKSNLSEKQIEADVATYLGWCTPVSADLPFRLLGVDEQVTGADKLFDVATPVYMQFKKSDGLKSPSLVTASKRKRRSRLDTIREFRAKNGLESDPTLFFQLRKKAKTAADFQHNVLLSYERPPSSRGIYVAPLVLNKKDYALALFDSTHRYLEYPFHYRLRYVLHEHKWASHFGSSPFLREHVSIAPHERVSSHNHFYAYSETDVDISWHSPTVVTKQPRRLSDFMISLFSDALANPEAIVSIKRAAASSIEIAREFGLPDTIPASPDASALETLQVHGRWLSDTYDIRQIVLLGRSDVIAEFRG